VSQEKTKRKTRYRMKTIRPELLISWESISPEKGVKYLSQQQSEKEGEVTQIKKGQEKKKKAKIDSGTS